MRDNLKILKSYFKIRNEKRFAYRNESENASPACLLAQYALIPGAEIRPATDVILITRGAKESGRFYS